MPSGTDGRHSAHSAAGYDGFARISVVDEGPGRGTHGAERIFEPFFTTKAGGIGMGLPICRSIVEAHGGSIYPSNNHGRGSSLCFTAPLAGGDAR